MSQSNLKYGNFNQYIRFTAKPKSSTYILVPVNLFSSRCHENYELYIFGNVCHNGDIINSIDI